MSRFGNLEFADSSSENLPSRSSAGAAGLGLREAELAFRRGDFEHALRWYGRILQEEPHHVGAWVGQVRMLVELGEFKEAGVWADKALEQFPQEPELLAAKAVTLARSGDLRGALAFSDAAIAERGDTPYVWLARGDVLLARAEKRADYCFNRALGGGGGDWIWSWLASRVHFFYRKFSLALKLITQALTLDGSQAVVWLQLGRCQLALGMSAVGEESLAQARELDPHCPEAQVVARECRDYGWWDRVFGRVRHWLEK
jgi:tetratricopeptide (TPR) repeat protein